jgi:Asp-tRNA(Asn)/Glu-tRNA(Gln) amidotransferase A subunit family amidase
VRSLDYQKAIARIPALNRGFDELFANFDAILTPSAPGTAPLADTTGSPAFCTLWSLAGMPCLNLPLMSGANGLPLGAQLVGPRAGDARLLRTARWFVGRVQTDR